MDAERHTSPTVTSEEDALEHFKGFERMLRSGHPSDCCLVIGRQSIKAHKFVLAARSPVFAGMFVGQPCTDSENQRVEINDIPSYEVALELVLYLYSGRVRDLANTWRELTIAADRYEVSGLKRMCETWALVDLDENNALEYLQLANRNAMRNLKERALKFIIRRAHAYHDTPEFRALDAELMHELFARLVRDILPGRRHSL